MSLTLNALKRIEARRGRIAGPADRAADKPVPVAEPEVATDFEAFAAAVEATAVVEPEAVSPEAVFTVALSPAAEEAEETDSLPDDVPPIFPPDESLAVDFDSIDMSMARLEELTSQAGSLYRDEPTFDPAELVEAEPPVIDPVNSGPYSATVERILRQMPAGRSRVLFFTSPTDGQGKTMTLARLAPSFARGLEGNVVVVDANFRNPDMARCLGVAPAWRLPDVLAGATDWAAAVQTTGHQRVSLLPGGTDGLCLGQRAKSMAQLLRELAAHYDLVVVDGASLAQPGTAHLAALCDATYLIVRMGDGSPRLVREAGQVLQAHGGLLQGCVAIDAWE